MHFQREARGPLRISGQTIQFDFAAISPPDKCCHDGTTKHPAALRQIHLYRVMRAQTANAFAVSSGDKRVDKTKQPEHWAGLEEDLEAVYQQRLGEINVQSLLPIT